MFPYQSLIYKFFSELDYICRKRDPLFSHTEDRFELLNPEMHSKLRISALVASLLFCTAFLSSAGNSVRDKVLFNNGWSFSLGYAGDMAKDFSHGTEYFSYVAKILSNNGNEGPVSPSFDDSSWQKVSLPHDWVVDLPFAAEASHSHGYKCVGWRYPASSVGWYRKKFNVPESDRGKRILIEFEGIFRDSEVFCNGIYLGHERSGYASSVYDLTEYLDYGADNLITVRVDASLEEGWYYEGAGIYRNVYLHKTGKTAIEPYGVSLKEYRFNPSRAACTVVSEIRVGKVGAESGYLVAQTLLDADGKSVATAFSDSSASVLELEVSSPRLWSVDNPYLYTLRTCLYKGDYGIENLLDEYDVRIGIRSADFDPRQGFLLNGYRVELKGCDLHLDHAGVGTGVPDELWRYKLLQLKKYGFNAIRSAHNPASPAMLDLCDELGFLVIDENRMMGTGREHFDLVERMIRRDVNHPSVILWSIGNEEWAVEYGPKGRDIAGRMTDFIHSIDSTRPVTYGNCGGRDTLPGVDVFGYNYIVQNPIEDFRTRYPDHAAIGTEETTGSGTRGVYVTDADKGRMVSLNRSGVDRDGTNGSDSGMQFTPAGHVLNVIERGWKYYSSRPWLGGLFYWTGFDYRGEPSPLSWPATGSQFGILDYCGFPKDEAFYLKSCWVDEPMVYVAPSWGLNTYDGRPVDLWVYSNCDEVQLTLNGKSLGKKSVPRYGHISWPVTYKSGKLVATGLKNGKKIVEQVLETPGMPVSLRVESSKQTLRPDGQDVVVLDFTVLDEKGREVPGAAVALSVSVSSNVRILGWGNGDPAFKVLERPVAGTSGPFSIQTFSGKAQLLLRSVEGASGHATVSVAGLDCGTIVLNY